MNDATTPASASNLVPPALPETTPTAAGGGATTTPATAAVSTASNAAVAQTAEASACSARDDSTTLANGPSKTSDLNVKQMKIMIVDDEPINAKVVRKFLASAGYEQFILCHDAVQSIPTIASEKPDLLLLDIEMPRLNGLDVLDMIRADHQYDNLPIIILTASEDRETKTRALNSGATDFLRKPVDPTELIPRVKNTLTVKAYQDRLGSYAKDLEREVRRRTIELEESRLEIIHCLARAAEYRDNETGHHIVRVGLYAGVIARHLGLDPDHVALIQQAAPLHDVGKIGIPDAILLKPGKLEPEEFEFMQKHCGFGKRVFDRMSNDEFRTLADHTALGAKIMGDCRSPILRLAMTIALTHHERWDGSGYPLGLSGEDIPLEGRITAVADVFDALSSKRPYKPAFPLEKCLAILEDGRGSHFDPRVLDAFMAGREEVVAIQIEYSDVD